MTHDEMVSKANQIIQQHVGADPDKIVPEADFYDDLGCDSLDMVELTMEFEEQFGIEISDDLAENCPTVGDVHRVLAKKLAK